MTENVIETNNLTKRFGRKTALNNFTLQIPRGGVHAIVGSNGAGKSTLFRILLGLLTADSGQKMILGEPCDALSPEARGRIGYVNEEHTLPGWMRVSALKEMQQKLYKNWNQTVYDQVIGNFDVDPGQKISALSRGERAGFNLSMALAQSPELLFLDEPTLGLDVVAKRAFLEALMFSVEPGESTTIYCSHQMDEIERVSDNLIIIEKGEVKNVSSPDDFLKRVSFWIADIADEQKQLSVLPGLLTTRNIEGQHHIFALDQDGGFRGKLLELGANHVEQAPFSLDQAVNAFLTKNHASAKRRETINA